MSKQIENIKRELIENSNETVKANSKRFFKEEITVYGVKTSTVMEIAKRSFKNLGKPTKAQIFALCEELWKSGFLEETFIACNYSYAMNKTYTEDDFYLFERWINQYINNWATCDTFCNHTVGKFLEMYPSFIDKVKTWTKSPNRWVRRSSAVSLIIPGKKGLFKEDIFGIADNLLLDKDDLVQKGYGWMLKSLSTYAEDEVYKYILSKREIMPRTALRYAIEKMPKEKKKEAMKREK